MLRHRSCRSRADARAVPRGFCRLRRAAAVALALVLATAPIRAATTSGTTGQSWKDPPLGEVLRTADLVAEVKVLVGGQFVAHADVMSVFRGSAQGVIRLEGFNSYEWNTAFHAMRTDETYVVALFRAGDVWCPATPSAAKFPVDRGRVVGRFGTGEFLVEVPVAEFHEALCAFFVGEPAEAARSLGRLLATGSVEVRYLAIVLLGELAAGAAGPAGEAVEILVPLARERNSALREAAAHALGTIGGPEAARALARFVADADDAVARAAALAVCRTAAPGACRELVAWLERSAQRGDEARTPDERADLAAQGEAFQFLAAGDWLRGAEADERRAVVEGMVEIVAAARPARARVAARVLGHIGAAEAVEDLARLLDAEDPLLRDEASAALTAITLSPTAFTRDRFAEWWREHRQEKRSDWIRRGHELAARAVADGTYDGQRLAQALLRLARDPSGPWVVRAAIAEGAGWSGAPLEESGGPLVAAFAERELGSPSSVVRASAARTLAGLVERFPPAARALAGALAGASCDADSDVRTDALGALARFDARRLSPDVRRRIAEQLLHEMERGTDSPSRHAAAAILSGMTGKHFGFYVSKGYELEEESRGLERWRDWWKRAEREGWTPRPPAGRRAGPGGDAAPVAERLKDPDPAVWLGAAAELVADGDGARARARELCLATDAWTRAVAAALLGLRAEAESAPALALLLDDAEAMVRLQAVWATGVCLAGSGRPPQALLDAAGAFPNAPRQERTGADEALPPSILDAGVGQTAAARPIGAVQAQAILALGKIGGDRARGLLAEAAASGEDALASVATWALALCPDAEADDELVRILGRAGPATPYDVLSRALAARRPPGAAAALVKAAAGLDRWIAYPLINALGRVVLADDVAAMVPFLDPAADSASVASTYALAQRPGPQAAEGLVRMIEEGGETARYYAAKAIARLGETGQMPDDLRARASAALAARLADYDVAIATASVTALECVGEKEAADAVFKYLRDYAQPDFRAFGAAVRLGRERGVAFALEQLATEVWGSKYFALRALRYAPTGEAVGALVKHWGDPESPFQEVAAGSLVRCGARAVRALAAVLATGGAAERRRAAMLLAEFDLAEARTALERAAASTDEKLARVARLALESRARPRLAPRLP